MTEFKTLEIQDKGAVFQINLNRPDVMNAFNDQMHDELRKVLEFIEKNKQIRCLVIGACGRAFCTGQDLRARKKLLDSGAPDLGRSLRDDYNPLILRLRGLSIPIVSVVQGVAAGAGCSLALAGDIVVAAQSASFVFSFARVGLVPDSGASWILPRLIGMARARALCLLAEPLSASEAEEWGMIWQCVPDALLASTVQSLTSQIVHQPATGLSLTREVFSQSMANDLPTQLDLEQKLQFQAGCLPDYREAVTAFVEKRKPHFAGQ